MHHGGRLLGIHDRHLRSGVDGRDRAHLVRRRGFGGDRVTDEWRASRTSSSAAATSAGDGTMGAGMSG